MDTKIHTGTCGICKMSGVPVIWSYTMQTYRCSGTMQEPGCPKKED